jgi:hypothetical protein
MKNWAVPPRVVPVDEWMSQDEAARELNISHFSLGLLLATGVLHPAECYEGGRGVTRKSLEAEVNWRRTATLRQRVMRKVRYVVHFI